MTCHLCETPLATAPVVGTMSRGNRPSRRVACVRCGLVQVSPQPSAEELAAYYRGDYHRDHGPVPMCITHGDGSTEIVEPGSPRHPDAIAIMHRSRAAFVVQTLGLQRGDTMLEIGCSDGQTLAEIARLGPVVHGVEPDASMAEAARDRVGPHIICGDVHDVPEDRRFDAAIAFHVLEHFPDPLSALAKIRRLLKPGGRVLVEVPNVLTPGMPLTDHWQWVHLYDFSPQTLAALLARAGFGDIHTSDRGPLRAWATHGAEEPSAYVDHGGPGGAAIAAALASATPVSRATEAPSASPLLTYIAAGPPEVRAEWERCQAATQRLASAYTSARDMLGAMGDRLRERAMSLLEAWHPDPYIHGLMNGQGLALSRADMLCGFAGTAMAMVEATDGGER